MCFMLKKECQNIPNVQMVNFVQPSQVNIQRIILNALRVTYAMFHLNFSFSFLENM